MEKELPETGREASCKYCGEVLKPNHARVIINGVVYHADCWDRSHSDRSEAAG